VSGWCVVVVVVVFRKRVGWRREEEKERREKEEMGDGQVEVVGQLGTALWGLGTPLLARA